MPKLNVYVPDEMYEELKQRDLPISKIAQEAFSKALAEGENAEWIARVLARPVRKRSVSTEELWAEVDAEWDAHS